MLLGNGAHYPGGGLCVEVSGTRSERGDGENLHLPLGRLA